MDITLANSVALVLLAIIVIVQFVLIVYLLATTKDHTTSLELFTQRVDSLEDKNRKHSKSIRRLDYTLSEHLKAIYGEPDE